MRATRAMLDAERKIYARRASAHIARYSVATIYAAQDAQPLRARLRTRGANQTMVGKLFCRSILRHASDYRRTAAAADTTMPFDGANMPTYAVRAR